MTKKDFQKLDDAARRNVAKKYGWRQSSYLDWKIEEDYIFFLFHCEPKDAWIEVKPLYFDDLWWEITGIFKNVKKPPMSLRGNGAAAISAQEIATYDVFVNDTNSYTAEDLEEIWYRIFRKAASDVLQFLKENPDANTFFPDESKVRAFNNDRLDYIMALLHNNREEEAIAIIMEAKRKDHKCYMRFLNGDGYDAILEWCKKRKKSTEKCPPDTTTRNSLIDKIGNKLEKIFKK
ncbi:MAG: hypothetical protein K6F47_03385 [Bacteroidaceae bacterium]|nr:hypothetical protein [Bacteroidaceae bacterium]